VRRREATTLGYYERPPWGRPELRKIPYSDCFVVLGAESFTKSGSGETKIILRYYGVAIGLEDEKNRTSSGTS
jgi:hypothetical protein